jgi:hypothetical protein
MTEADDSSFDSYDVIIGRIMRARDCSHEEAELFFIGLSRVFDIADKFPDGTLETFVREMEQESIQRKAGK